MVNKVSNMRGTPRTGWPMPVLHTSTPTVCWIGRPEAAPRIIDNMDNMDNMDVTDEMAIVYQEVSPPEKSRQGRQARQCKPRQGKQ